MTLFDHQAQQKNRRMVIATKTPTHISWKITNWTITWAIWTVPTINVICQCQLEVRTLQRNRFQHLRQHFKRQLSNSCQVSLLHSRPKRHVRQIYSFTKMSRWKQVAIWFPLITLTTTAVITSTSLTRTSIWSTSTVLWRKGTRRRMLLLLWAFLEIILKWLVTFYMNLWAQIISQQLVRFAKTIVELNDIKP